MEQISSILQPFYHSWIGSDGFAHPAANHPIDADIGVESEPEANSLPFAVIVLSSMMTWSGKPIARPAAKAHAGASVSPACLMARISGASGLWSEFGARVAPI